MAGAGFDLQPAILKRAQRRQLIFAASKFGETRERGGFLAVLRADLERVGIPESIELPDHLSHVLALLGREEPGRAAILAALVAPAVAAVRAALEERETVYADLLAAVDSLVARRGAGAMTEAVTP